MLENIPDQPEDGGLSAQERSADGYADEWMMEALGAGGVEAHVVRGPTDAEVVAAHRKLTDEGRELGAVGIAARLGAQASDAGIGDAVPVAVEDARAGRRTRSGPG